MYFGSLVPLEPALRHWLETDALPGQRVAGARTLTGGYTNHNILVTTTGGGAYVLRRYRRGNACAVEAALARRLSGVVPVAEVVAADETGAGAGEPALLSVFVPGRPLGGLLAEVGGAEFADLGRSAGAALARVGSVSFAAPGFFADERLEPDPAEPTVGLDAFVDRCLREGHAAGHLGATRVRPASPRRSSQGSGTPAGTCRTAGGG